MSFVIFCSMPYFLHRIITIGTLPPLATMALRRKNYFRSRQAPTSKSAASNQQQQPQKQQRKHPSKRRSTTTKKKKNTKKKWKRQTNPQRRRTKKKAPQEQQGRHCYQLTTLPVQPQDDDGDKNNNHHENNNSNNNAKCKNNEEQFMEVDEMEYDQPTELSGVPWPQWVNDEPDPHDWTSMFPVSSQQDDHSSSSTTATDFPPLPPSSTKFQLSPRMAARLMNEAIIIVDDVLLFGPQGGGESGDLPLMLQKKIFVTSKKRRIQFLTCFERLILRLHNGVVPKPNCMGEVIALHILIDKAQEAFMSLSSSSKPESSGDDTDDHDDTADTVDTVDTVDTAISDDSDNNEDEHLMGKHFCLPKTPYDKDFKALREYLFDSDDMAAIDSIFDGFLDDTKIGDYSGDDSICTSTTTKETITPEDNDDEGIDFLYADEDDCLDENDSDDGNTTNDEKDDDDRDDDDDNDDSSLTFSDDMVEFTKQTIIDVEMHGKESPAFQTLLDNFTKIRKRYWIMSPSEDQQRRRREAKRAQAKSTSTLHQEQQRRTKMVMIAYCKIKIRRLPGLASHFTFEVIDDSKLLNLHPERWFIPFSKEEDFTNHI